MTSTGGGWEGLDPWEKIIQWREVAPEISEEILQLAKARAVQSRHSQLAFENEQAEAARFEREQRAEQARRDHEVAKARVDNEFFLSKARQIEQYKLANRLWWTQLVGTVGGLLLLAALVVTQWQFAATGNFGPIAAILGMGGALTAGVYGMNAATKKNLQALAGHPNPTGHEGVAPAGLDDSDRENT